MVLMIKKALAGIIDKQYIYNFLHSKEIEKKCTKCTIICFRDNEARVTTPASHTNISRP